jgi:hypothetical protein
VGGEEGVAGKPYVEAYLPDEAAVGGRVGEVEPFSGRAGPMLGAVSL